MKSRNANYKLLEAFKGFEQGAEEQRCGTSGNIASILFPYTPGDENHKSFYDLVSAPMLLARLVSAGFSPIVEGQAGYKVTWTVILIHKETGCTLTFYDYKGASSFGASIDGYNSKKFIAAVKKLTEALADERFPHPYDGCVVGEIA